MRELSWVLLFNVCVTMALQAFATVVAPLIRRLGLAEWHGGVVVALAGVCWMLLAPRWGRESDRRGRLMVLRWAASGFVLAMLLLALLFVLLPQWQPVWWASWLLLLLARGALGMCYAGVPVVSAALVAERLQPDERMAGMARLGMASALGMVLGPPVLGWLAVYGLSAPMWAAVVVSLLGALALFCVPLRRHAPSPAPAQALQWFDARLRVSLLAGFVLMGVIISLQMTLGFFLLDRIGASEVQAARWSGLILGAVGLALVLVQGVMGRLSARLPGRELWLGSLLLSLALLLLGLANSFGMVLGCYVLCALGLGLAMPAVQAQIANAVPAAEQGAAAGRLGAAQGLASVVFPLLSMAVYRLDERAPYWLAGAGVGLLLLCLWCWPSKVRAEPSLAS